MALRAGTRQQFHLLMHLWAQQQKTKLVEAHHIHNAVSATWRKTGRRCQYASNILWAQSLYGLSYGIQVRPHFVAFHTVLDRDSVKASCHDCLEAGLLINPGPHHIPARASPVMIQSMFCRSKRSYPCGRIAGHQLCSNRLKTVGIGTTARLHKIH